jgi:hypothetical protein
MAKKTSVAANVRPGTGKAKTPALYAQKLPKAKRTAESEAAAAHFWVPIKEEPPERMSSA